MDTALVIIGGLGLFTAIWVGSTAHRLLCVLIDDVRRDSR